MKKFNPTVRELIEEDVTVIGLYWAGYWRFIAAIYGALLIAVVMMAGVVAILE